MVINLEWGAFGDQQELNDIRTKYDVAVNDNSENINQQTFEKLTSGMYLGELFRLVLIDMIKEELILDGKMPPMLLVQQSLSTEVISLIENDPPGSYKATKEFLLKIGIEKSTDGDCMNIRYAAECISRRSANLVSAGLAVILNRININDIVIGVDGSVYRYHPHYHQLLVNKISELVNSNIQFSIMLSVDGSGRGAAVLSSAVCP